LHRKVEWEALLLGVLESGGDVGCDD
jgi:hypothetical protein